MKRRFVFLTLLLFLSANFLTAQEQQKQISQIPKVDPFSISRGKSFSASTPKSNIENLRNTPPIGQNKIVADFQEALEVIKKNHVDTKGKKVDDELTKSAISAMLSTLDPHSGAGLTLTTARYYKPSGRSIQRDYSNGNLYDYYQHKISLTDEQRNNFVKKTVSGRKVYGGDGIMPDAIVESASITRLQNNLVDPIFMFSRKLAAGSIKNLESSKIIGKIEFGHRIDSSEFPVTKDIFQAFSKFMQTETNLGLTDAQIDGNAEFISERIRFNLITAKYGTTTAQQVLVERNEQVLRAIQSLPQAKQLAFSSQNFLKKQ